MQQVAAMPPTLSSAILWDAWETLEPLQRQHWLGAQLVSSYLRARGKLASHLFGLNFGLKVVPRDRRRSRDRTRRLVATLEAMAEGAALGMKEIIRLGQARDRLERKLQGKRSSSSLPGVVDLLFNPADRLLIHDYQGVASEPSRGARSDRRAGCSGNDGTWKLPSLGYCLKHPAKMKSNGGLALSLIRPYLSG